MKRREAVRLHKIVTDFQGRLTRPFDRCPREVATLTRVIQKQLGTVPKQGSAELNAFILSAFPRLYGYTCTFSSRRNVIAPSDCWPDRVRRCDFRASPDHS